MAGFMDFFDTDQARLGMGLLAAAGPRADGAGFGQRLMEGVGSLDQWKQQGEQKKLRDMQLQQAQMQMDDAKRKQQQEQAQRDWRTGLPAVLDQKVYGASDVGPTMAPDTAGLNKYLLSPDSPFADKLLERKLFPKEREDFTLGTDQVRFGGNGGVIAQGPVKAKEVNPNEAFMVIDGKIVPNTAYQEYAFKKARAGASSVTTNMPTQESEQSKTYGKNVGEMRAEVMKAGMNAPATIAALDRMDQLLADVDGGKYAPAGLEVASAARSFGLNIDPKLGNKEAAQALAVELALKQKPVGSGAMSDPEFDNYLSSVPSLSKTPEGRKNISVTMRAKAKRDADVANMARNYAKKNNGVIDDGFFDEVANYRASNPIIKSDNSGVNPLLTKYPPRTK